MAGRTVSASQRCRNWSRMRRLVYAAGSPLIPILRLWRLLRGGAAWQLVPWLLLGLAASATGELAAYLAGPGAAKTFAASIETRSR